MFKAEVRNPSNDETPQIPVDKMGWLFDYRENVESCLAGWVGHRGQVDKCLYRSAPELSPNPLVFLSYLLLRRVRRPIDADPPEIFEGRLDCTVALIQDGVELRSEARDGGAIDEGPGAAQQH